METLADILGEFATSAHWRKPLRLDEVNRLAPTAEVRARPGERVPVSTSVAGMLPTVLAVGLILAAGYFLKLVLGLG